MCSTTRHLTFNREAGIGDSGSYWA